MAPVAAALVALLAACTGSSSGGDGTRGTSGGTTGTGPQRPRPTFTPVNQNGPWQTNGRGPELPARGYWAGAWQQGNDEAGIQSVLDKPLDILHTFHPWVDPFPTRAEREAVDAGRLLMLSWAGTDTRDLASGQQDDLLRQRAEALRDLRVPLLMRFRWEMDRPNLRDVVHSPEEYVAAWKHARSIFDQVGATNVAWVWCPLATGFIDGRAAAYYPGDDQVDWLCADAYPGRNDRLTADQLLTPFLEWARSHPRPIVIGEFAAQRGSPGWRAGYLTALGRIVAATGQVKALVYYWAKRDGKPVFDSTFDDEVDAVGAFRALMQTPGQRATPPRVVPAP